MKEELDKLLVEKYPLLYCDRYGPRRETCMRFGFPGDGWYGIIDEMSAKLEREIARLKANGMPDESLPRAFQVKEKFGMLTTYLRWGEGTLFDGHDPLQSAIEEAERKSLKTCMKCGAEGELRTNRSWHLTLCDECDTKK